LASQRLAAMIHFRSSTWYSSHQESPRKSSTTSKSIKFFLESAMLLIILLIVLIFGFGYGGYRVGPGFGYYGGGSISLILTIVLILLLLRVI